MLRADLHMHSVYSDGTLTIKKLLDYAKSKRLDIVAITDHDSTMGVEEAIKYGKEINIKVIAGIELSTAHNDESVHVLGYFNGEVPEEVKEFSKQQHEFRRERIKKMAQNMIDLYGFKIDFERLMKPIGTITRAHLIREIAMSNPEYEKEYIYNNCLRESCPGYIQSTKLSTAEGIEFLRRNGALIVIAHPTLLKKNDILDLITPDVDGLEAIYPKNKPLDEKIFRSICDSRGMIITAGSDYHGIIDYSHEDLAYNVLEGEDLEKFLKRLGDLNENN